MALVRSTQSRRSRHKKCLQATRGAWFVALKLVGMMEFLDDAAGIPLTVLERAIGEAMLRRFIHRGSIKACGLPLRIELTGGQQRLGHVHAAAYCQVNVEDWRPMALAGGLATQAQLQRQACQTDAGDGLEVMQPGCEGPDAVEAGSAKHEAI